MTEDEKKKALGRTGEAIAAKYYIRRGICCSTITTAPGLGNWT